MKRILLTAVTMIACLTTLSLTVEAQLIQFDNRSDFDNACPGTVLEDFEDIEFTGIASFPTDFVDQDTDIFIDELVGGIRIEPGDIAPGLTINTTGADSFVALDIITPSGKSLGPDNWADGAVLEFDSPVDCLAFDIFGALLCNGNGRYEVSYFDANGVLIDSIIVEEANSMDGIFTGVAITGSNGIGSMRITAEESLTNIQSPDSIVGEVLDNIAFRTLNPATEISANSINVFRGIQIGGVLEDSFASDDQRLSFNPGFTINSTEAPVWLIFDGTLSNDSPNSLEIVSETQANSPGLTASIDAFNWNTSTFDNVDLMPATFNSDSVVTIDLLPGLADYVQPGTGAVRTRIGWRQTGFTLLFPWEVRLDQLVWSVQ